MNATTIQLTHKDGLLYFPRGGYAGAESPSMLVCVYAAGDVDTCVWPFQNEQDRRILASALFSERECNSEFPSGASIALPDGEPFDFDSLVD